MAQVNDLLVLGKANFLNEITSTQLFKAHGGIALDSSTEQEDSLQYVLGIKPLDSGGNIMYSSVSDFANVMRLNATGSWNITAAKATADASGNVITATYAIKNHASSATTYGVGDANNYGHVLLYPAASCTSYTSDSGGALTPAAVKKAFSLFGARNGVYYVVGNTSGTEGVWSGTNEEIPELFTGLTIAYKIGIAGGSESTTLNIATAKGASGAKPVKKNAGNTTTHLPVGTVVHLTYDGTNWCWPDYDSNTNTQIRVYRQTSGYNSDYPILVSRTATSSIGTADSNGTYTAVYGVIGQNGSYTPTINPHTGAMKAYSFTSGAGTSDFSAGTIKFDAISIPNASNSSTFSAGSSGQVLKTNGTTVYWGSDNNTDTKVTQNSKSDNVNYPLLGAYAASPTSGTASTVVYDTGMHMNPSTNTITATKFVGSLTGNADTATTSTYLVTSAASDNAARHVFFAYNGDAVSKRRVVYDDDFKYNPSTNVLTVGSITGNAATATAFSSAATVQLTGDVTGSVSSTKGWTVATTRRGCSVGQSSSTATNPWYKFASIKISTAHQDEEIAFKVTCGFGTITRSGILRAHVRLNENRIIASTSNAHLYWEYVDNGIDVNNFVLAYSTAADPTVELWVNIPAAWTFYHFDVLQENSRAARGAKWTLYNTSSAGSQSAITSGYTQIKSTALSLLNNAATATTATNVNITKTTPTGAAAMYYINFSSGNSGANAIRANDDFYYYYHPTDKYSALNIGKTSGNGILTLHKGSYMTNVLSATLTADTTHTLPATGGTILNTGTTSFTQTLTSGTKIGTIKINGTSTDIYCQTNTNTDTKTAQDRSTSTSWRAILAHYTDKGQGVDPGSATNKVYYNEKASIQPSTGKIYTAGGVQSEGNITIKGSNPYVAFINADGVTRGYIQYVQSESEYHYSLGSGDAASLQVTATGSISIPSGQSITPRETQTGTVGTSSAKWSAMYATNFYGLADGAKTIRITTTNPTDATTYNIPFVSGTAANTDYTVRGNDGFRYNTSQGTTTAVGWSGLYLGNSTASGAAGNKAGRILLYGQNSSYTWIQARPTPAYSQSIFYLPAGDAKGDACYAVWSPNEATAVGSSTAPVYVATNGKVVAGSTYAGGTKVTLNGTAKGATTASFYAPTSAGTAGQLAVSTGGAPGWSNLYYTTRTSSGQTTPGTITELNLYGSAYGEVANTIVDGRLSHGDPGPQIRFGTAKDSGQSASLIFSHYDRVSAGCGASLHLVTSESNSVAFIAPTIKALTKFIGDLSGNASSATKWATARTFTIGATGKSVNGTADVSWTPYEMRVTRAQYNVGSNMNQVADHGCELGMVNLSGTDTTVNPNGETSWHHYINMTWSDCADNNSTTTNEWCTQIANKAGTTDLWVRSRSGGTIAAGTAWAAPWTRILTGSNWTSVVDGRYLKLAGGTMSGTIFHDGESVSRRILTGSTRNAGLKYDYNGNESFMISAGTYATASILLLTGGQLTMNDSGGQWNASTTVPAMSLRKSGVAVNYNLTSDPTHNFYVKGTSKFDGVVFGYNYTNSNNAAAFMWDKNGSNYTGVGSCDVNDTILFAPCTADGTWVSNYEQIWRFQGSIEFPQNSARIRGNTATDYTPLYISGEKNGYSGIACQNGLHVMSSADHHGLWDNTWIIYRNTSHGAISIGTAQTSSNGYAITLAGSSYINGGTYINGNTSINGTLTMSNSIQLQVDGGNWYNPIKNLTHSGLYCDASNTNTSTYWSLIALKFPNQTYSLGGERSGNTFGIYSYNNNRSDNGYDGALYVHGENHYFYCTTRLYGAVWNDYAEFRTQEQEVAPGYCVASRDNGKIHKTNKRLQACDGIVSDTYGFSIGENEENKTPLAVAGRVLAYCEGDKNDYHAGDTVCASENGKVCKMTREEIQMWPDRIVGTVSEIPDYEIWGTGKVKVNGRIWIKVK